MLSKDKVVKSARKALELLYDGTCKVVEHQKVIRENKSTGFEEVIVLEDVPCRLSFKSIDSNSATENGASAVNQRITLFLAPDVEIASGAKIIVTQNGVTTEYQQSGKPALYDTHQEIVLDYFREWA